MTGTGKAENMFLAPTTGGAMFQAFCRMFFLCYCRLTVEGLEHVPASPFILCSNHTSHIDSAVLMTASGLPFSNFAMLGASDYFFDSQKVKFIVSRFMNIIAIDRHARHNSLRRSLDMCAEFLRRPQSNLILYPEGTRSASGKLQPFKKGAGLFAVELGVPVVPAYIEGAPRILAKGRFLPRPGRISVRFGEPIGFAANPFDPQLARGLRKAAVELLEQRIRGLSQRPSAGSCGELMRGPVRVNER
jgi:1-acyl-sn-glycerol-3-phosphate acyltransferase